MRFHILSLLCVLAFGLSSTNAALLSDLLTVVSDVVYTVGDLVLSLLLTVAAGTFMAITSGVYHIFGNGITVETDAALYIGSEDISAGIYVSVAGDSVLNGGIIVLDATNASSASTYQFTPSTFENSGELYFNAQSGQNGSNFAISAEDFVNTGLMYFGQENGRYNGTVGLGVNASVVDNSGTICIDAMVFEQDTSLIGIDGCIDLGIESLLNAVDAALYTLINQTIILSDETAAIRINASEITSSNFTVLGLSTNLLGLTVEIEALSYDSSTGILTLLSVSSDIGINIYIGLGYDEDSFSIVDADYGSGYDVVVNGAVSYSGDVPSYTRPSYCNACPTSIPWYTSSA